MFFFQLTRLLTTLLSFVGNTLETKGYQSLPEKSTDEKSIVNSHLNELPLKFSVGVKERQTSYDELVT